MNTIQQKLASGILLAALPLSAVAYDIYARKQLNEVPPDVPLSVLSKTTPNIENFDGNGDQRLNVLEARKYLDEEILIGNNNFSKEQIAEKIYQTAWKIEKAFPRERFGVFGERYYPDYGHRPKNIQDTIDSFMEIYRELLGLY